MADGKVTINTSLDNTGFKKGINEIGGSLGGLKTVLGRIGIAVAAAFSVRAVINFSKQCIELGSDVTEVQNVVDTAFGSMAYKMENFARTSITQFGMSQLAAKKTGSTYMAMAKGMGMADNAASDMAISLTGLTGDVASFYNITQEEADTKLKSIFTGETETLKSLGVVMTQANLDAYALANGFGKTTSSMNQAELVQLRYAYVTNALNLASGDFVKTQGSWANQTRILSMQWQQFMSVIGQAMTTVLLPVVKMLNSIVSAMIDVANTINTVVTSIFGGANKQIQQTADTAAGVSDAISDSVDNQNALTAAAKKTAQASQAGFDELNTLQNNSDTNAGSTGADAAGGGSTTAATESPIAVGMQSLVDKVQALVAPLKAIDLEPLSAAFERLRAAIAPITQDLFSGLSWAWTNLFVPLAKWTAEDALPAFLDVLSGACKVLGSVLSALQPLGQWLWDSFLHPIAAWTGGIIVEILKELAQGLNNVSAWIDDNQQIVQNIAIIVESFAAAWVLVNGAIAVWNAISGVATMLTAAFGSAVAFLTSPIGLVVLAIGALIAIVVLLVKNWDTVQAAATNCLAGIKSAWNAAGAWFNSNVVQPIAGFFGGLWNGIKSGAGTLANYMMQYVINPVVSMFRGMYNAVVSVVEYNGPQKQNHLIEIYREHGILK